MKKKVFKEIERIYDVKGESVFKKYPDIKVFRHKTNKKWFAIFMNIDGKYVERDGFVDIINIKLEPEMVSILKRQDGFHSAYHMNKIHWISIILEENDLEKIMNLIEISYNLTT